MNKFILVSVVLVAALSCAVYAYPDLGMQDEYELLSLLEEVAAEQAQKRDESIVSSQKKWDWGKQKKEDQKNQMIRRDLEKKLRRINAMICTHSHVVFKYCPAPEIITEVPATVQKCNNNCGLRASIKTAEKILDRLENPSFCDLYSDIVKRCGEPEPETEPEPEFED